MLDCRHCGERLTGDTNRFGARCPRCREPLYERTDASRRQREGQEPEAGICAVHGGNRALGVCLQCKLPMCGLCRTRWDNQMTCIACLERRLSGQESTPEDLGAHRKQALIGLLVAAIAWTMTIPLLVVRGTGASREVLIGLLILASFSQIPALFGAGQAAAAVRIRGDRMALATTGLVANALQVGLMVGIWLLVMWKQ